MNVQFRFVRQQDRTASASIRRASRGERGTWPCVAVRDQVRVECAVVTVSATHTPRATHSLKNENCTLYRRNTNWLFLRTGSISSAKVQFELGLFTYHKVTLKSSTHPTRGTPPNLPQICPKSAQSDRLLAILAFGHWARAALAANCYLDFDFEILIFE